MSSTVESKMDGMTMMFAAMAKPENFTMRFDNNESVVTVSVKSKDLHKLAKAVFEFIKEKGIECEIKEEQ